MHLYVEQSSEDIKRKKVSILLEKAEEKYLFCGKKSLLLFSTFPLLPFITELFYNTPILFH